MLKYRDVNDWLSECRNTVKDDLDNLILFTGPEGNGKSTLMVQVMRALDPTFSVERIHFGVEDFLENAPQTPRYCAVAADELLLNHRKGMHGGTIKLLDYLQVCRGLNTHMAICFPHVAMFDGAVLNFRVRWKVHVPRRGLWVLSERVAHTYRNRKGEEETIFNWIVRGKWTFERNKGPFWEEYLEKKEAHMRAQKEEISSPQKKDLGFDIESFTHDMRVLRVQYAEASQLGAPSQDVP